MKKLNAYISLTKPRITVLFAFTAIVGLVSEGSLSASSLRFWMIIMGVFCVGGAANAFNQYFEREIDARMERTATKRSLPLGILTPFEALLFSVVLSVLSIILLYSFGNVWTALIGVGLILFYSFFYTLYLKPTTPHNIVIGGVAGALGPVLAWVGVTAGLSLEPILMFLIIFFWSPPHFWALALYYKDDYAKVGFPMLPVVKGESVTRKQIFIYSLTLLPLSLSLYFLGTFGWLYGCLALVSSLGFIYGAWAIYKNASLAYCKKYFAYSIFYIAILFIGMLVDKLLIS
ncbi:MAG: protoheme IX farnesyltransferase [Deltaproteobacteria bacterium]|nr:protoheme IX farnesyltransferase [Deltaproteobacteria bacterium]